MKNLFEIKLNEDAQGLLCVSLVNEPAIEEYFDKFSKLQRLFFNEEKRIVKGVALIPNMVIDRGDYDVFFSKDTIAQLVEKYSKENKLNLIDIEHDGKITDKDAVCIESYITSEDSPYKDFPAGCWIVAFKIYNDDIWHKLKDKIISTTGLMSCYVFNKHRMQ